MLYVLTSQCITQEESVDACDALSPCSFAIRIGMHSGEIYHGASLSNSMRIQAVFFPFRSRRDGSELWSAQHTYP